MELEPTEDFAFKRNRFAAGEGDVLVIACGALAREIVALIELNRWRHVDLQCLPAIWHNHPERIPAGVAEKIHAAKASGRYRSILVAYGDCGTGGLLDKVLVAEGVERIGGPHCYAFFSGNAAFMQASETEFTSFYLTDYLARHFDSLIWRGFGLDRHPELLAMMFGNYEKIVYLAQTHDAELEKKARDAAAQLKLAYEFRYTGYGELASFIEPQA